MAGESTHKRTARPMVLPGGPFTGDWGGIREESGGVDPGSRQALSRKIN